MKFILMAIAPLSMMLASIIAKISEMIEFLMDMATLSGVGAGVWWLIKYLMDFGIIV